MPVDEPLAMRLQHLCLLFPFVLHADYMDEDGDADLDTEEQSAEDSEEEEEEGPKGKGGVRRGLGEAKAKASKKPRAAAAGKGKKEERDSGSGSEEDEGTYPPSFCPGVDLSQPEAKLRAQWPSLPSMSAGAEVVVEEGQMLYLPAGGRWGWCRAGPMDDEGVCHGAWGMCRAFQWSLVGPCSPNMP